MTEEGIRRNPLKNADASSNRVPLAPVHTRARRNRGRVAGAIGGKRPGAKHPLHEVLRDRDRRIGRCRQPRTLLVARPTPCQRLKLEDGGAPSGSASGWLHLDCRESAEVRSRHV